MSDLEARYRTVLLWYPSTWREENADVVVGTLMDEADAAGRSHPRASELLSLAINGVQARLGRALTVSRGTRDRLSALSFGAGFAMMAIMFVGDEWAPFAHDRSQMPGESWGPFLSAAVIVNLLWIMAFAVAVFGLVRWSRVVLVLACIASVAAIVLINATPQLYARPPASALAFLILLAAFTVVGRPSRRWLLASAGLSVAGFVLIARTQYDANSWGHFYPLRGGWFVASNGWWGIALFVLAGLLIALRRVTWVTPVAASAVLWSLYCTGASFTHRPDYAMVFGSLFAILVAVVALAVGSLLLRGYRLQVVRVARE